VGLQALKNIGYLVEIDGTAKAMQGDAGIDASVHISYRVFANGHVHLKIALADDTNVILAVGVDGLRPTGGPSVAGGLLARDGNWGCEVSLADGNGMCADDANVQPDLKW
jgi:hypothetical protein